MHYWTPEGQQGDRTARPACGAVNAGHGRRADQRPRSAQQLEELDYAPSFQIGHPKVVRARRAPSRRMLPGDLDHAFYCNSGSEAVDSALKIALAWQRARGQGTRTRLIGRERGYHGVGFGGISVGGIVSNRKQWGVAAGRASTICPHTHLPAKNAFSRGLPDHGGVELADELERIVALHDASTIAAVIVEPCAGSTGVPAAAQGLPAAPAPDLRQARHPADLRRGHHRLRPPRHRLRRRVFQRHPRPHDGGQGHLQRARCRWAACSCASTIYDGLMNGPENVVELFHGYTYSGHPLACAAASLPMLDIYQATRACSSGRRCWSRSGPMRSWS